MQQTYKHNYLPSTVLCVESLCQRRVGGRCFDGWKAGIERAASGRRPRCALAMTLGDNHWSCMHAFISQVAASFLASDGLWREACMNE